MRRPRPRRESERGFALLLVFALAASIALLIYLEIPRVAFERQRDREALLVDRGEQFMRAVELYARKVNKLPQTLDDLEKSNNIRFLRRRYRDPMTNSDEWRLVHVDATGQYTDSKVHKRGGGLDQKDSGPSVLASRIQGIGQNATVIDGDSSTQSVATQRRASDRIIPGSPGATGASGASNDTQGESNGATNPPTPPPPPGVTNQNAQQGASPRAGINPNDAAANAALLNGVAGDNNSTGAPNNQGSAFQAVQNLLGNNTQPRGAPGTAGGASGLGGAGGAGGGVGAQLGAGIVGVATKRDQEGILRYNEKSNYTEWEFLFEAKANKQGQNNNSRGDMPNAGGTPAPARAN